MKTFTKLLICVSIVLFADRVCLGQSNVTSPILFIYDGSGSMWAEMEGETKKETASRVFENSINALPAQQPIGLMAYGHRRKSDCEDVEMLVDLSNTSKETLVSAVRNINPTGKTPLARSAIMAIQALKEQKLKATIVLITDGIESCDGNICDVIKEAKAANIEFRLHIIGFGIGGLEKEQLLCAAQHGEGNYYNAQDASALSEGIYEATNQTVDKGKGNFSVFATKNGEPVDVWVKLADKSEDQPVAVTRSYRDTAFVFAPRGSYIVTVNPLEGLDIPPTSFELEITDEENVHRDISFDAATLLVRTSNNGDLCDATVRVYDHQTTGKTVVTTRTYAREKTIEIEPGKYNVEFKALQIKGEKTTVLVKDIVAVANESRSIQHNFETGTVNVGIQTSQGELVDAVIKIIHQPTGNVAVSGRSYTSASSNPKTFVITPGTYEISITTLGVHKGVSKQVEIILSKGKTIEQLIKI